ncbi:hypothetical protein ACJMK2_044770 [Sinanodonta woodiana]
MASQAREGAARQWLARSFRLDPSSHRDATSSIFKAHARRICLRKPHANRTVRSSVAESRRRVLPTFSREVGRFSRVSSSVLGRIVSSRTPARSSRPGAAAGENPIEIASSVRPQQPKNRDVGLAAACRVIRVTSLRPSLRPERPSPRQADWGVPLLPGPLLWSACRYLDAVFAACCAFRCPIRRCVACHRALKGPAADVRGPNVAIGRNGGYRPLATWHGRTDGPIVLPFSLADATGSALQNGVWHLTVAYRVYQTSPI